MKVHEFTVKEQEVINFKKRSYVRRICSKAIKKGELIKPKRCELCNRCSEIEAHHVDYGRPLQVTWLCKKCHTKAHHADHPLNPNNNNQTAMPHIVNEYKYVTVTFELPIKNFLALKSEAERQNKPIGKIMREKALELFPVSHPQLEFKLENTHDKSHEIKIERVSSVEENERLCPQPERTILPALRGERNYNLHGVGSKLFELPARHGGDTGRLQRARVNR